MQAYEGYYENGQFYSMNKTVRTPGRRRAILTVLDESLRDESVTRRLAALDEFYMEMKNSDENVPEFERIRFREIEI